MPATSSLRSGLTVALRLSLAVDAIGQLFCRLTAPDGAIHMLRSETNAAWGSGFL